MKIFVDGHFLDGRKHGAANYLERIYLKYSELAPDHEIYFGIEQDAPADYELFAKCGVHIVRYRFGRFLRFIIDIPILAHRLQPDIIHTQYVMPLRFGFTGKLHVTLFDVLYEDFPQLYGLLYRWTRRLVFGWSAKHADLLSTCSEYSKGRICLLYRPKAQPVRVIHGGVMEDLSFVDEPIPIASTDEFVLYVSRFEKRKNHLKLLQAFVGLLSDHPRLRLILVGFDVDGSGKDCHKYINDHKISDRVQILTNISDENITALFRSARVVVYPSLCEGFGMPIIEAMLLNCNTIFSNTTAMADFALGSDSTFDPLNVIEIRDKIDDRLRNGGLDVASWQTQRTAIARKFNWNRSAEILLEMHEPGRPLGLDGTTACGKNSGGG